jgi:catechol 2,3-dioxygenase-like lactoylglutathione lyase family enzyme
MFILQRRAQVLKVGQANGRNANGRNASGETRISGQISGNEMAAFNAIVPVLKVTDMQRALDFYAGVLGFKVRWREANDDGDTCMLDGGATNLLLSTGSHLGDKPQFTGTLSFNMVGVAAFFEQIKNDVEIVWPLEKMDYGQTEFGIKESDGYVLAFAEGRES